MRVAGQMPPCRTDAAARITHCIDGCAGSASQCDMLAIILCGGSGTRLWPVSREAMPKPCMRIGTGPSLIQRTALRARTVGADSCIVVTNAEYTFKTIEEITALDTEAPSQLQLLLEPVGRNTAPAIAAACVLVQSQ